MAQFNWAQPTVQTGVIGNSAIANTAVGLGNVNGANINNFVPYFTTSYAGIAYGNVTQLLANASLQFDGANLTVGNIQLQSGSGNVNTTGNVNGNALYAMNGAVFNSNTVDESFTVNGYNAGSVGPITTAPGVVVDITNGSWVIS